MRNAQKLGSSFNQRKAETAFATIVHLILLLGKKNILNIFFNFMFYLRKPVKFDDSTLVVITSVHSVVQGETPSL